MFNRNCNWQEKKPKTATALLLKRMFFVGKVSEKKRKLLTSDDSESSEDLESKCKKKRNYMFVPFKNSNNKIIKF